MCLLHFVKENQEIEQWFVFNGCQVLNSSAASCFHWLKTAEPETVKKKVANVKKRHQNHKLVPLIELKALYVTTADASHFLSD